jgi:hypothetical protein
MVSGFLLSCASQNNQTGNNIMNDNLKKFIQQQLEHIIVKISVSTDFDRESGFRGTGFFITTEGYILTAWHCIQDAGSFSLPIIVECSDGEVFSAQLDHQKSLQKLDIAVLKVGHSLKNGLPLLEHVPKSYKGDAVVSACYSEIYKNQLFFVSGDISLVNEDNFVATNVIQGPGQSGGPVYHYGAKRIIGVVTNLYEANKLRNCGLTAELDFLFQQWPALVEINQAMVHAWEERLKLKTLQNHQDINNQSALVSESNPQMTQSQLTSKTSPTTQRIAITTCEQLYEQGILEELAKLFNHQMGAKVLLNRIGFPKQYIPAFTNAFEFWQLICEELEAGRMADGFDKLITAAANQYPYNKVFAQLSKL